MAVTKKADDSAYRQFRRELETGNLGNLYIFHGEETYLRDHYLGELKSGCSPAVWMISIIMRFKERT